MEGLFTFLKIFDPSLIKSGHVDLYTMASLLQKNDDFISKNEIGNNQMFSPI